MMSLSISSFTLGILENEKLRVTDNLEVSRLHSASGTIIFNFLCHPVDGGLMLLSSCTHPS